MMGTRRARLVCPGSYGVRRGQLASRSAVSQLLLPRDLKPSFLTVMQSLRGHSPKLTANRIDCLRIRSRSSYGVAKTKSSHCRLERTVYCV